MSKALTNILEEKKKVKIVIVGDENSGKTSFISTFLNKAYPSRIEPKQIDIHSTIYEFENKRFELEINVAHGTATWLEKIRPSCFPETDLFFICFSIDNLISFDNALSQWYYETYFYHPSAPRILLGLQNDKRKTQDPSTLISVQQGITQAKDMKAINYLECSIHDVDSIRAVFEVASHALLLNERKKNCSVS